MFNTAASSGRPSGGGHEPYAPGDDFYEILINAHRDLSDEQSELLNARLILLLANHIGDIDTLREALAIAREGV